MIYRKDRSSRGGGVLLVCTNCICSRSLPSPPNIEVYVIELLCKQPLKICLVYNPPNSSSEYQKSLLCFLSVFVQTEGHKLIMGDFICPDINWSTLTASSEFSSKLCDLLFYSIN